MSFADTYLSKQKNYKVIYNNSSHDERFIIVIPCYNEPFILNTLQSIYNCNQSKSKFKVLIVINSSEDSSKKIKVQNIKSIKNITDWYKKNRPLFNISIIHEENLPKKYAGAGLARKIGMDEAIRHFNYTNNPEGIIISLDADTLVDNSYLTEIELFYLTNPAASGCTICYEHPVSGKEFNQEVYNSIVLYELYLRYFVEALRYCQFPFAFHTIGSCFTIKAEIYVKSGGMNKRQGGEDFYFLHKVFPHGNFYELNSTRVCPSPRISNRVPFGTGPAIKKIIENNYSLKTYDFQSFKEIKKLIEIHQSFFKLNKNKIDIKLSTIKKPLITYLNENDFSYEIDRINKNCAQINSFSTHFFNWFNAFRIIKYINYAHEKYYQKQEVINAINNFLSAEKGLKTFNSTRETLNQLRHMQKKSLSS